MARKKIKNYRLYRIWHGMKQRCFNRNSDKWNNYGKQGITICQEWLVFDNFYNWSIEHGYKDNLTIDRIDSNGNYEPSNCQWITREENSHRTAVDADKLILCIETGQTFKSITEAARSVDIGNDSIYQSINLGCRGGGYHWKRV